ncbi:hypothetical protein IscW_ISCW003942 [Ixodes scapularis]|uniref:Uncharacterized protein n=1 Tax=Ixodes scapularis TaxID=6945 RepID=B7PGX6_IXOSC|nr:hypothetical protein IscW_ISCW003942 [Ixodes scapularis]|eukprot:XP_002401579.1 hypothetical protein IscW_ISCW003942 [Ixodes scapularis]
MTSLCMQNTSGGLPHAEFAQPHAHVYTNCARYTVHLRILVTLLYAERRFPIPKADVSHIQCDKKKT